MDPLIVILGSMFILPIALICTTLFTWVFIALHGMYFKDRTVTSDEESYEYIPKEEPLVLWCVHDGEEYWRTQRDIDDINAFLKRLEAYRNERV